MPIADIKHVFVLMLENRSYDHMLGALPIKGFDPSGTATTAEGLDPAASNRDSANTAYPTGKPAPRVMPEDPPHEYDDVRLQLLGANGQTDNFDTKPITNSGFVRSYETVAGGNPRGDIMASFRPSDVSVLGQLAQEFCTCDRWFSSLPGPTVPNRFFLFAASSNGDPKSPSSFSILRGELGDQVTFKNGTIFKRIKEQTKLKFIIYRGDDFPLSLIVDGVEPSDTTFFDPKQFAQDCRSPGLPEFIFIEPAYGIFSGFRDGNSQHPVGDIQKGERLIKDVYEGIRNSPAWPSSVLVVTYDEHGGFYDHVIPPGAAPSPGDVPPKYHFDFTQLGVRVPAVIVSPLISPNTIDHTHYDHTSILATLRARFPEIGWFTERDRLANDLGHLFTLTPTTLRANAPVTLNTPPAPLAIALTAAPAAELSDNNSPPSHTEAAFIQVAAHLHAKVGKAKPAEIKNAVSKIHTKAHARAYLKQVGELMSAKKAAKKPKPKSKAKRKR